MFGKAIFPTEITDWPSSPRNVNENELGTQVKQQLQDGTVCAIRVEFGLVFPRITELPVHYSSRPDHCSEAGVTLEYGQIYQNYSFKRDRALCLLDKTISIQTFHFLTFARVDPQFIKRDLCHRL